jgi:multicomponent K+:H+ antiporter subunit D
MSHLPVLPFVIPLIASTLLMMLHSRDMATQRGISLAATLLGLGAALLLVDGAAAGTISVYALGNWPPPYGIVLVVDRLAALMVLLVFLLAIPALLMASSGWERMGRHFHALFQLQLAGLAAAFLTGDLFNLFVCFEILLLGSYALLVHGMGAERARAGLHYVVLNLVGSTLFLVAIGILYGTLGTLNIADMALLLPQVPDADVPLVRTGLMLLMLVFLLKGALLPMAYWLPRVYPAATVPVAALFAIMTKVGIVALLRIGALTFPDARAADALFLPWLPLLALLTIALGTVGAFAARRLAVVAANLVLISSGTLLFAAARLEADATAAILYYLPHTTLVTGGFFLLAGAIAVRRGRFLDRLERGPVIAHKSAIGLAFLTLAIAASGLPPLSGFLGKLMMMQGAASDGWTPVWWATLLFSGLGIALVLARVASTLFWEPEGHADSPVEDVRIGRASAVALALAVVASPVLTFAAAPVSAYARAAAEQLHERSAYVGAVLPPGTEVVREWRPGPPEPEAGP